MILHDSDSQAQNGDGPEARHFEAANSTGAGGANEQSADAHFSSPQCPDKRGTTECYQQFVADRQAMLRSWRAAQAELSFIDRHHELHATTTAMRCLLELGG